MGQPIIKEETKATSQHQITIPKKIWDELELREGTHFQIVLTEDKRIVVIPKLEALDLSDEEWRGLVRLARRKDNISKQFTDVKKAASYLKKL